MVTSLQQFATALFLLIGSKELFKVSSLKLQLMPSLLLLLSLVDWAGKDVANSEEIWRKEVRWLLVFSSSMIFDSSSAILEFKIFISLAPLSEGQLFPPKLDVESEFSSKPFNKSTTEANFSERKKQSGANCPCGSNPAQRTNEDMTYRWLSCLLKSQPRVAGFRSFGTTDCISFR